MPLLITSLSSQPQYNSERELSGPRAFLLFIYILLSSLPFESTFLLKSIPSLRSNLVFTLLWTAVILPSDVQIVNRLLRPRNRLEWLQDWYGLGQLRGWTIWFAGLFFVWAYVQGDAMGWYLGAGVTVGFLFFGWVNVVLCREIKTEKDEMQRKGYEPVRMVQEDTVVGDRVSTEWVDADA